VPREGVGFQLRLNPYGDPDANSMTSKSWWGSGGLVPAETDPLFDVALADGAKASLPVTPRKSIG